MALFGLTPTAEIPFDVLAQTFTYAGGFLATITAVHNATTYVQTFTNDGTNITATSGWVAQ